MFYLWQFTCDNGRDFAWSEHMSEHIDDLWRWYCQRDARLVAGLGFWTEWTEDELVVLSGMMTERGMAVAPGLPEWE
jgi:hypothetical protein